MRSSADVLFESRQLFAENGIRFRGSRLFRALIEAVRADGWPTQRLALGKLRPVDFAINERAQASARAANNVAARAESGRPFIVAFYEIDRTYGGPEEGGWWYATGSFTRVLKCFATEYEALKAARRANDLLERLQRRKTPVSSVAYTGGRYEACVHQGTAPKWFPEQRPYYE